MSADKNSDIWKQLRKPFPAGTVGKLPKGGMQLDYVGHAAVTDRLLEVDPTWTWEPLAVTEQGLPAYDNAGGLWIKLTVNGVTRLGYGDGPDPKQRISDALRNAAMRFGVALDLWSKEELESTLEQPENNNERATTAKPAISGSPAGEPATAVQKRQLVIEARKKGVRDEDLIEFLKADYGLRGSLTKPEAARILSEMQG